MAKNIFGSDFLPGICNLQNRINGCFIHLQIVHQTVGPAWMNHLMNCPVYHFATVMDCPPFFELFDHWFVVVGRWVANCLTIRGPLQS